MVRLVDLPQTTQTGMANLECPLFATTPFVSGPPLGQAPHRGGDLGRTRQGGERPFVSGDIDYRVLPGETSADQILMSHVSVNFDRTAFVRDINVVFSARAAAGDGAGRIDGRSRRRIIPSWARAIRAAWRRTPAALPAA